MVLAVGCDRGEKVEEPRVYDPTIDSPPSTIVVEPDPLLLANQVEIAKKSPKRTAPVAGTTEIGGELTESVKKTVLALVDALEAKQADKLAGFFVAQDAPTVKTAAATWFTLREKLDKQDQLIQERFGPGIPPKIVETTLTQMGLTIAIPEKVDRAALQEFLNQFQFTTAGNRVTLSAGNVPAFAFVNVAGTWKIELSPEPRLRIGMVSETVTGIDKLVDALTMGISDGSITKDNLVPTIKEQGQATWAAVMAKFESAAATEMTTPPTGTIAAPPAGTAEARPSGTVAAPAGTVAAPPVAPSEPNTPVVAPPPAPAPQEDINRDRGPEKAQEMRRRLMAPATRVYGGGS
jgi:hypothetical protein